LVAFLRVLRIFIWGFFFAFLGAATKAAAAGPASVSIEVAGSIEPRCSNTGFNLPLQIKDLSQAGSSAVKFEAGCNAPFQYSVVSRNGGFKLDGPAPPSGFAANLPYNVSVRIPLTGGQTIEDRFTSDQIKSGASSISFSNSGNAVSIQKTAEIGVAWEPSAKPLSPGAYQDQLTVKIFIRP
jgi:hypothetical protein